jgi:very-short-patch-repair endonuclease
VSDDFSFLQEKNKSRTLEADRIAAENSDATLTETPNDQGPRLMEADTTGDVRPATIDDARDLAFALWAAGPEAVAIYIDRFKDQIDCDAAGLLPLWRENGAANLSPPFTKIYRRAHRHWLSLLNRLVLTQSDARPLADGRGDSQIETALFAALVIEAKFGDLSFERVVVADRGKRVLEYDHTALTIEPQASILEFRVDFLLTVFGLTSGIKKQAVIECDGHNFHERTREQASRDRARDNLLRLGGYIPLRYTGSDIWRDPCKHASQIIGWAAAAHRDAEAA